MIAAMSVLLIVTAAKNDNMVTKIYAFGFAASFNDSIVYFTDIQEIDSAHINGKSKFLVDCQNYSNQLRNYLSEKKAEKNKTCVFVYALKRKDIEKKYMKMKGRYTKQGTFDIKEISTDELKFNPIAPTKE